MWEYQNSYTNVHVVVIVVSEGLEILKFIGVRGGCLLSDLAIELGIPKSSVISWVSMLCSTGYLKKKEDEQEPCSCKKSGLKCVCCSCLCNEQKNNPENRIELTSRGIEFIRGRQDEKNGVSETISGNGRLPRNDICT